MAQLSIRTQNEDGESVTRNFHLEDDHADEESEQLEALARQAEQVPQLREEKSDLESELETARDVIVSDIVRRKKLSGELEGEDEIEDEREFLSGLPASRLKKHWDRAPSDLDTGGTTDLGASSGDGEDAYDKHDL